MSQNADRLRIFITGGAGFVGSNLVKYFLDKQACDITVYDNLSTGSKAMLDEAITDSAQKGSVVKFIEADILDYDTLKRCIKGNDAVVHLAAHTQVRESITNPGEHLTANSIGTFNVIDSAKQQGVDKFIFASSNAAVGEQIPPINESMIARPLSPYGAVKLYGESLCSAYYNCYGLKTASLRFANVYGPYSDHKTSVVAKFTKRIKNGKVLEIYGDGKQTRDFIHAEDIAQAIYLFVANDDNGDNLWGQVFQVATGHETSIIDLAEMIIKFTGSTDNSIEFGPAIKGEIRKNFSDITKIKNALGFVPQKKLEVELKTLCDSGD